MKLSDFSFELPDDRIATRPVFPRTDAKLLVAQDGQISDQHVGDLPDLLRPGDLLVLNDTKVIPARLTGHRTRPSTQGPATAKIEITLLDPQPDGTWTALVKPLRKWAEGEELRFSDTFSARLIEKADGQARVSLHTTDGSVDQAIDAQGTMPLPPYIAAKRPADDQDKQDYQTIWARQRGAVAAPTASLHFDDTLLAALKARGVDLAFVTLHVGAGTFLPVKVDDVTTHKMHAEWGEITPQAVEQIQATKAAGGRVIPVGTTALRLIETAATDGAIKPWTGSTDIFIYPGFDFHVADGLMTNFHLPESTLLMLVSALMGHDQIQLIYDRAIARGYRFFSYGDASILFPNRDIES
ncbi:MAG: tRNA preQ1(34) S-adenosylmethionine ribosyltransferase-isomerase QueA [Pseudomonadota bacterium]